MQARVKIFLSGRAARQGLSSQLHAPSALLAILVDSPGTLDGAFTRSPDMCDLFTVLDVIANSHGSACQQRMEDASDALEARRMIDSWLKVERQAEEMRRKSRRESLAHEPMHDAAPVPFQRVLRRESHDSHDRTRNLVSASVRPPSRDVRWASLSLTAGAPVASSGARRSAAGDGVQAPPRAAET